jgi:hypothetical protein
MVAVKCHVSSAYFRSSLHGAEQIFVHGSNYIEIWLFERIKIIECPKNKTVELLLSIDTVSCISLVFSVGTVSWPHTPQPVYSLILHRAWMIHHNSVCSGNTWFYGFLRVCSMHVILEHRFRNENGCNSLSWRLEMIWSLINKPFHHHKPCLATLLKIS